MTGDVMRDRLVAIVINDGELNSAGVIAAMYKRRYADDADHFGELVPAVYDLVREEVFLEHDVESESLGDALIEHTEHGQLSNGDLSFVGVDDLIGLGPKSLAYVHERASEIANEANSGGLKWAIEHLKALPVDSRKWTGLPSGIRYDDVAKAKIVDLLGKADTELDSSNLSNSQAWQARALIKAALALTETPEPEFDILVRTLKRLGVVLSVSSSIATLLAFVGLAK